MNTVLGWILGVATVLGGIAAVLYFREKWLARNRWAEQDKIVNSAWWESSDLKREYESKGFASFSWSNRERVAERVKEGAEVVLEIDPPKRVKYKLVNQSGQVLIAKRNV